MVKFIKEHTLLFVPILLLVMASCQENKNLENNPDKKFSIFVSDTSLRVINGILFYKEHQTFNGELKEAWPNGELKSTGSYLNGKQQGVSETFYGDGKKESTRWYSNGEKDSVHTGWWWNGNKKYEYHFRQGEYNGMFTEWYESGKMIQQVMYERGKELNGKGWRENGKLYMNFVMKDGRRYGMNNPNLCYGLKRQVVRDQ
jgi:antitoxin component YwqK of YwqJK toxin-antitoxin module